MKTIFWKRSALAAALAGLAACGGGGVATAPSPVATVTAPAGGIDRSGVTIGTISAFGSVVVGGTRFETIRAQFLEDEQALTEDDLQVGDVVTVIGTIAADGRSGVAETILYDAEVDGPVASVDASAGTFVVLGRTIRTNSETVFDDDIDPPTLATLLVDDRVEVSGFVGADGAVLATRIDREDGSDDFEVKGTVVDLDSGARRFRLAALEVDYGAATLVDFDGAALADGDRVEVKGRDFTGDGALIATEVELEDDAGLLPSGDDDDDYEIEGLITALDGDALTVGVQPVRLTADTEFEDGSVEDLELDLRVEVEGRLDGNGVLIAEEIDLEREADTEVEGILEAVDPEAGTLTVSGFAVRVTERTQFEDDSDADLRRFSLADLVPGDFLEVRGRLVAGVLEALRIERDDDDDDDDGDVGEDDGELSFSGPLEVFDDSAVRLLGVDLLIAAATAFEIDDIDVGEAEFRAVVEVGDSVDVQAFRNDGGELVIAEIEFDTDD